MGDLRSGRLTRTTLGELWAAGVPIEVPLGGTPRCALLIDFPNSRLRLRAPYSVPEPNVERFRNIEFTAYVDGSDDIAEIGVIVTGDDLHAAHAMLMNIADRVQLENQALHVAVGAEIAQYEALLAVHARPRLEWEVGLFGELSFLRFLVGRVGANAAVQAWHGPLSEEHDFVLDDLHLEVKTTASERRVHVVHGMNQLLPHPGIPLVVLSTQVTRSAAQGGETLPELVASARSLMGSQRDLFESRLIATGWDDREAGRLETSWALRSAARAFVVDSEFPAITAEAIESMVPNSGRVLDVAYTIDLTDMAPYDLPAPLHEYTGGKD